MLMCNMKSWTENLQFSINRARTLPREKEASSPYFGVEESAWKEITAELLRRQELDGKSVVEATLKSWNDIFQSNIGPARIGRDIFPAPQVMGFFLHGLIPINISTTHKNWKRDHESHHKDLVNMLNDELSIEIKTSSDANKILLEFHLTTWSTSIRIC